MQTKNEVEWEAMGLPFSLCKEPIERPTGKTDRTARRGCFDLEMEMHVWQDKCMTFLLGGGSH